jgi:hypothetical protein
MLGTTSRKCARSSRKLCGRLPGPAATLRELPEAAAACKATDQDNGATWGDDVQAGGYNNPEDGRSVIQNAYRASVVKYQFYAMQIVTSVNIRGARGE